MKKGTSLLQQKHLINGLQANVGKTCFQYVG
jgi:hypothetical protein